MTVGPGYVAVWLLALATVGVASVDAFGWLHGMGCVAAVWLLSPIAPASLRA
jgi:hypothetical protein